MGTESSKDARKSVEGANGVSLVDFPNVQGKGRELPSWSLLHQCTLDNWKQGHAEVANFSDSILSCDRTLHKDCSLAFCMSRQGVINIDRSTSMFSFKRRMKFAKMAEHFEYNHIPAQMSSVNHFRVKSVLCFRDSLVVLHLSRNGNSQFGLLDLESNKFLGVFGKQPVEFANENFSGELSPDKSKCLVLKPMLFRPPNQNVDDDLTSYSQVVQTQIESSEVRDAPIFSNSATQQLSFFLDSFVSDEEGGPDASNVPLAELLLYDMSSKHLLSRVPLKDTTCHFSFDPRHNWCHVALTNFGHVNAENSLSLVEIMAPSSRKNKLLPSGFTSFGNLSEADAKASLKNQRQIEQPDIQSSIINWIWGIISINHRLNDHWRENHGTFQEGLRRLSTSTSSSSSSSSSFSTLQKLVDLRHSRDGRLLVATMLEMLGECRCREKKSGGISEDGGMFSGVGAARRLQQIQQTRFGQRYHTNLPASNCTLYVFDADTAMTLRCIQYQRYVCQVHSCPTNYVPVFSTCGTRMAVVMDATTNMPGNCNALAPAESSAHGQHRSSRSATPHHVQVYQLPSPSLCLQALCRAVLLESRLPISGIVLPPKILNYLKFSPEFD